MYLFKFIDNWKACCVVSSNCFFCIGCSSFVAFVICGVVACSYKGFEEFVGEESWEEKDVVVVAPPASSIEEVVCQRVVFYFFEEVFCQGVVCCGDCPACGYEFSVFSDTKGS